MAEEIFRPWGLLPWLLHKLPVRKWSLLGCLAPEQRCLAAMEVILRKRRKGLQRLFAVIDPPSRYSQITTAKIARRRQEFLRFGGIEGEIEQHELFERVELLVSA